MHQGLVLAGAKNRIAANKYKGMHQTSVFKHIKMSDNTPCTIPGRKWSIVFPFNFRRTIIAQSLLLWAILLSGCETVHFYTQATAGQIRILSSRRPVEEVIHDPGTSQEVRRKLELVSSIRAFAEDRLDLPVQDAYASYVETGQSYVVWNVFAAPELSLEMKTFCFPVAGCVNYKGFFKEADARDAAAALRRGGYDVYVGGVVAYSTLGWFDDPIMDTFLRRNDTRLAALLFHELAHKAVYVPGDTSFNEGFATALERYALKQWLSHRGNREAYAEYEAAELRRQQVIDLIRKARDRLVDLYGRDLDTDTTRQRKHEIIEALREDYRQLRQSWDGHTEFQTWMTGNVNNAAIGAVGAYQDRVPAFETILRRLEFDIPAFVEECRELAAMDEAERERAMRELVQR